MLTESSRKKEADSRKAMRFGFRWSACTDAICIEDDGLKSSSTFTVKLQSRSSKLGRQASNDILYGSLACSQLNKWLVAALCSAECTEKEMSIDGRMSADCIRAKQPELQDALDHGGYVTTTILTTPEPPPGLYKRRAPAVIVLRKKRQDCIKQGTPPGLYKKKPLTDKTTEL